MDELMAKLISLKEKADTDIKQRHEAIDFYKSSGLDCVFSCRESIRHYNIQIKELYVRSQTIDEIITVIKKSLKKEKK